jgi:hypothetical protein
MASQQARSAALLISVYIDAEGGAAWYAQLRGFRDSAAPEQVTERVSDKTELLLAVQRWLDTVVDGINKDPG